MIVAARFQRAADGRSLEWRVSRPDGKRGQLVWLEPDGSVATIGTGYSRTSVGQVARREGFVEVALQEATHA